MSVRRISLTMICLVILILTLAGAQSPSALLFAVFLHEAAHVLCALIFFRALPRPAFTVCGLRLIWDMGGSTSEAVLLSLSGPMSNFLLWLFLPRDSILAAYSLSLCIFNLIPASGLDGGEICARLAPLIFGERGGRTAAALASGAAVGVIFFINCAVQLTGKFNLSLMLCTLYLIIRTYGK